ncbi:MAG: hypothetical protein CL920_14695 [Deltaproteobacteria bacterium]|nr:hypothetical protein [Deltaproteobacteria bacterium]MBU49933.1 hypothetical protein [Deltaproteobacteria bacterium]|tara:strand:+ start:2289 stop:2855 length:567 start_codon:yes stop_codon:yes gene_type:complete
MKQFLNGKMLWWVTSSCLGCVIGVTLMWYVSSPLYHQLDKVWVRGRHEISVELSDIKRVPAARGSRYFVSMSWKEGGKTHKVSIENSAVFDYVQKNQTPPFALRVNAEMGKRWLTGEEVPTRIATIGIKHPFKASQIVLVLALWLMGGAVLFASIKDLLKRISLQKRKQWDESSAKKVDESNDMRSVE